MFSSQSPICYVSAYRKTKSQPNSIAPPNATYATYYVYRLANRAVRALQNNGNTRTYCLHYFKRENKSHRLNDIYTFQANQSQVLFILLPFLRRFSIYDKPIGEKRNIRNDLWSIILFFFFFFSYWSRHNTNVNVSTPSAVAFNFPQTIMWISIANVVRLWCG